MTQMMKDKFMTKISSIFGQLFISTALLTVPAVTLTGCATAAYQVKEKFGIEKRDTLVSRVSGVANSQAETKAEFEDALEAFRAVVDINAGELETAYDNMNKAYKQAESQANDTRSRVKSVKRVAKDLFKEWEAELSEYQSADLRRTSQAQLKDTQQRYAVLAERMDAATASMDPVLSVFKDRVLYLKHNLNARAIAALNTEASTLETDVARLIAEMERSIAAADEFISNMQG